MLIRHIMGMSTSYLGSAGWAKHVYRDQSHKREYNVISARNLKISCEFALFLRIQLCSCGSSFYVVVSWIDHLCYVRTESSHIDVSHTCYWKCIFSFQFQQWHLNQRTHLQLVLAWSDTRPVDSQAFPFTQREIRLDNKSRTANHMAVRG